MTIRGIAARHSPRLIDGESRPSPSGAGLISSVARNLETPALIEAAPTAARCLALAGDSDT
jgi:hypothetical protein